MSPDRFNRIVHIANQEPLIFDHVYAIREIFRAHKVEKQLGLQLLHSHYTLPAESIALTIKVDDDLTVTKITHLSEVSVRNLRGQLYCFTEDQKFQAYEYEYGSNIELPTSFLEDLAHYITENRIEHQVAIAISVPETPTIEVTLGSNATATLSSQKAAKRGKALGILRMIGWQFDIDDFDPAEHILAHHLRCHETLVEFDFDKSDVRQVLKADGFI